MLAQPFFLEEPYSYDGNFLPELAIPLFISIERAPIRLSCCGAAPRPNRVSSSAVTMESPDTTGFAIPLMPYLYAVELPEQVPLYTDPKLVAFLRDQYRAQAGAHVIP